jgi:hypothetical protein
LRQLKKRNSSLQVLKDNLSQTALWSKDFFIDQEITKVLRKRFTAPDRFLEEHLP